jgi:shikimate kinase
LAAKGVIILAGIKHSGKTTLGRLLAARLGVPFYDTDQVIAERTGKTPRQLYLEGGEGAFMRAELEGCRYLAKALEDSGDQGVAATGGGICNNVAALEALKKTGTVIYLQVEEAVAAGRIIRTMQTLPDGSLTGLPAYIAKENPRNTGEVRRIFHRFYEERARLYLALADRVFIPEDRPAEENAAALAEQHSADARIR